MAFAKVRLNQYGWNWSTLSVELVGLWQKPPPEIQYFYDLMMFRYFHVLIIISSFSKFPIILGCTCTNQETCDSAT